MPKIEKEKAILIIRDGWGYRKEKYKNAIKTANTPFDDNLLKSNLSFTLFASGSAVGLPKGFQGNSEVGHITIGAGRVIEQSLVKINNSIKDKSFFKKKELLEAAKNYHKHKTNFHIIGLIQREGVHSHINYLFALLDFCKKENIKNVYLHIITDGRDSPVNQSIKYLKEVENKIKKIGFGEIVTISGRYYAMDRDNRYERTKKAYLAICKGESKEKFSDPKKAIKKSYEKKITDEFIIPAVKKEYKGVQKNDTIVFFNFRTDRTRQITKAIIEKNFKNFKRKHVPVLFIGMTNYYQKMNGKYLFQEEEAKNILGEVIEKEKLNQLRISETEKYAHVSFFFNNQKETSFKNEERILVPSPMVKTYDKKPEMSINKLAEKVISNIKKNKYHFIVVNLVNADMVGHSGIENKIKKAVEAVDKKTKKITKIALKNNYTVLITADHGNAEDQREKWRTSHTTNPVKLTILSNKNNIKKIKEKGELKNIAPTILEILKIKKPKEMIGQSLIKILD